ncbi:MAG: hypothetical protein M0P69_13085 [Bacteroidales bacterium]|jgi:hypothetical protein|nr:hypothetical protein [Bacteroidales bacterium]
MLLNKLFDIVVNGPKNKVWYIIYIPVMLAMAAVVLFLLMGVLPELIAYGFGLACIIWVITWPVIKIIEWVTGRKIL